MSTNYEKNKNKILNDYYKMVGAFLNCQMIYESKTLFELSESDTEEQILIKIGRKEDLLSELGKVGEKLCKYILGLEYLKTYPNSDENNFESFFRKSSVLKDFSEKHGIKESEQKLQYLYNYNDANNQKAHNYDYWFLVIEMIMPEYLKKIQRYLIYLKQSDLLISYCQKHGTIFEPYFDFDDYSKAFYEKNEGKQVSDLFKLAIFPDWAMLTNSKSNFIKKRIEFLLQTNREAIRRSGDIFTRFRYAANNLDNKDIDLDETFNIINKLVAFVMMIHENDDNLDFDLEVAYAKYKALQYSDLVGISKDEIEKKLDLDLGYVNYSRVLLNKKYSSKELDRLLNLGISKHDLWFVVEDEIFARDIEYSRSIGIYSIDKISEMKRKYVEDGQSPKM